MNNKIFKYTIISILFIFALALSGCFNVVIRGEIDENFLAVYQGEISINLKNQDNSQRSLTQESLLKLSQYWQDIGYESAVTLEDDTYSIYYKKQAQGASYENAFQKLFEMMTDDYSPFSSLSYVYTEYENYAEYQITGILDISDSMDDEVYNNLNEDIKQTIDTQMQNLNANIVFVLPGQEYANEAPSIMKTYTAAISSTEATDFTFTGKINNIDKENSSGTDMEQYQYYNNLKYVLIGILLVLMLLTLLVISKMQKSRK